MSTASSPSPFPLALTAFESLMWQDQRRHWPMTFFIEAEFAGRFDRQALEIAASEALSHHPLLRANLRQRLGKWQWVLPDKPLLPILWRDGSQANDGDFFGKIDLRMEGGVRLIAEIEHDRSRLIGVFHHAATDGIGALLFVGDLLAAYHRLVAGEDGTGQAIDWDLPGLVQRGRVLGGRRARPAVLETPAAGPVSRSAVLNEALQFLTLSPLRLAPRAGGPDDRRDADPPYAKAFVPAPAVLRLRELATSNSVPFNDLLLREIVLTVLDWQMEQASAAPERGVMRITMPVNLRSAEQRRLPAANVLSYGFVHSRPGDWNDSEALLRSIATETRAIQEQDWAQIFLTGLEVAQRVPGMLPLILTLSRSFSTVVFSNLGDVVRRMKRRPPIQGGQLVAGNLVLERFTGVPPVRPGTRLAMAAMVYNGTLGLAALGCPRTLGTSGAERFLELFVGRLTRLAAPPRPLPVAGSAAP